MKSTSESFATGTKVNFRNFSIEKCQILPARPSKRPNKNNRRNIEQNGTVRLSSDVKSGFDFVFRERYAACNEFVDGPPDVSVAAAAGGKS